MSGRYSPAEGGSARSDSYQDYQSGHDQGASSAPLSYGGSYDSYKQSFDTDGARDDRDRDYNRDIPRGPRFNGPGRNAPPIRGRAGMRGGGRGYHRDFRDRDPRDGYPPRDRDERDFDYDRGRSPGRGGRSPSRDPRDPDFRRGSREGPPSIGAPEPSGPPYRGGRGGRGWPDWQSAGRGRPVEDREREWNRPRSRSRERRWERETPRSREDREERLRIEREEREREAAQWKQQKRQQDGKPGVWSTPSTPHFPTTTSPRVENRVREFPERRGSTSTAGGQRERSDYFGNQNERYSRTASPPAQSPPVPAFGTVGQRSASGGSWTAPSPNLAQAQLASAFKAAPTGPRGLGIQPPTGPRSDRLDRVPAAPKSTSSLERSPISTGPDVNSPPMTFPRSAEGMSYQNRSPQSHFSRPVADRKSGEAQLPRNASASSLTDPNLASLNVPTGPRAERDGRGRGTWNRTTTSVPRGLPIKRDHTGMEIDQPDRSGSDTQSWSGRNEAHTDAIEVKTEAANDDVDMGDAAPDQPVPEPRAAEVPRELQSKSILSQLAVSTPADDTMDEDDDVEVEDLEANDKKLSEELEALKAKFERLKEEKQARIKYVERLEAHLATFVEDPIQDTVMEEPKTEERPIEEEKHEVLRDVTNRVQTPPLTDLPFLILGKKDLCQENMRESDDMRHHVAESIRLQRQKTAYKHHKLTEDFEKMYKPWIRQACQMEELARRPPDADPAVSGEIIGAPPILTPTLEGGRRANRGNYVTSELVFEQVLRESAVQEEQQRLEREARAKADIRPDYAKEAVVPDMINDEVEVLTSKFRDTNLRLHDAAAIRERFRYLPPKDTFTVEEQATFIKNFLQFPKKWGKIAQELANRDYKDCIHHYYLTKHQAKYKQSLNTRGRRRAGRRPRNGAGPKSNALMADLGIAPDVYNGEEFEQPSAVSETGRPRRAAAPTFGESKNNTDDSEGGRKVASTPKDDTENPMEKVKRPRAKQQRKPRTQAATVPVAPSPQKPEKPKDRDIIITNTPPPPEYMETHVPPPEIPQPRPIIETHVPPPVIAAKPTSSARDEKENNSYWSGAEMSDFGELLKYFGSDFASIAHYMSKKSSKMVHNWFKKNVDKPGSQFNEWVTAADERIRRDGGPGGVAFPHLIDAVAKRKYEKSMANGNGNGRPLMPDVAEHRPLAAAPPQQSAVQPPGSRLQTLAPTHEQPPYQPSSQSARQQPLAQKAASAAGPQRGFFSTPATTQSQAQQSQSQPQAIQAAQPYAPAPPQQIRNTLRPDPYNVVVMQSTPAQQQLQEEQAAQQQLQQKQQQQQQMSRDAQRTQHQPSMVDYRRNTYERPSHSTPMRDQYEQHEQNRYGSQQQQQHTPQPVPPPQKQQQLPPASHGYQPTPTQSHMYDPLGRSSSASSPPVVRPVYKPEPAPYLQHQQQQHIPGDRHAQAQTQQAQSISHPVAVPAAAPPKAANPPRKSMNINALLNSEPEEPAYRYGSASTGATATPPPTSTPHRPPPPPPMEMPKHEPPAYRPSYGGYELSHSSRQPQSMPALPPQNSYKPSGPPPPQPQQQQQQQQQQQAPPPPRSAYGTYQYPSETSQSHSQPPPSHHYSDRGSLPPQQQQQAPQAVPPSRYSPYPHTPQHMPSHSHSHGQSMQQQQQQQQQQHPHYPHSQPPPPLSVYGTRTPAEQQQQQQSGGYRLSHPPPGSYDDQK